MAPLAFAIQNVPSLILPIGISGSGKSYWINSLNSKIYRVVSPDEIRKELTGDISNQSRNNEVFKLVPLRTIESLKKGFPVIVDATNLNTDLRNKFIAQIKEKIPTLQVVYKIFKADPELSKERIKKDIESGKDRSKVPSEVIDKQMGMYNQTLNYINDDIKSGRAIDFDKFLTVRSSSGKDNSTSNNKTAERKKILQQLASREKNLATYKRHYHGGLIADKNELDKLAKKITFEQTRIKDLKKQLNKIEQISQQKP